VGATRDLRAARLWLWPALALLLLCLGLILFDVPPTPMPVAPAAHCPGGLRLRAIVLPNRPDGKGPLLLAVDDGNGNFSFFLTPQPRDYSADEVEYRWVALSVCKPIVADLLVPAGFLVQGPADTATVGRALAQLFAQAPLALKVVHVDGVPYLAVNRLLPPGATFSLRLTVAGRSVTLSPRFLGAGVVTGGGESYFALPPLPPGRAAVEILAPVAWRGQLFLTLPAKLLPRRLGGWAGRW
jgi:hypothetical protein